MGQLTQDGIAAALGKPKANVSRSLSDLKGRGCVEERIAHVRGTKRRRTAYFPTAHGLSSARALKGDLEEREVRVESGGGAEADHPLHMVPGLLGRPAHFTDILMCLSNGRLRLVDLEERVGFGGRAAGGDLASVEPASTFVGRDSELASIRVFLGTKGALAVAIRGLAGIGKTTLARQYVREFEDRRAVLWIAVNRESSPLSVLSSVVRFLASRTFRPLSGLLASGMEGARLTALLATELARVGPLIVLDDLHKASADLTSWVADLLRACQSAGRTQFILVSRTPLAVYDRSMVSREDTIREITLRALPTQAVAEFLRGRIPDERLPEALRIGGNPLCLRLIAERGLAVEAARQELEAFLEEQVFDALSPGERRIVEQAAVLEGPAPRRVLLEAGSPTDLRSLTAREVLQGAGEGDLVLHDAIREMALKGLSPARLRDLHRVAAQTFRSSGQPDDFLAAIRHSFLAGAHEDAADLFAGAAEELIQRGRAPDLAAILASAPRTASDRPDFLVAHGCVLEAVGSWDGAIQVLRRAESAVSDEYLRAQSQLALGRILGKRELYEEADDFLRKARAAFEALGRPERLAEALYALGNGEAVRGRLEAAHGLFEEMRNIAFASGNRVLEGLAVYGLGRVADEWGDYAASERSDREALSILERTGSIVDIGRVLTGLGGVVQAQKRHEEAQEILERAIAAARRSGDLHVLATALYNLAVLLNILEKPAEAEQLANECLQLADGLGKLAEAANITVLLGRIAAKRGALVEAKDFWTAADERLRRIDDRARQAGCLRYLAMNCHFSGERDLAVRYLREARELAEQGGHPGLIAQIADSFRRVGVDS